VTAVVLDMLLALAVLTCWLGVAGFARLKSPLDRLHCVTFVNAASGIAILVAAFIADGVSARTVKILLLNAAALASGAALAHATGRALLLRQREK
jgi:multicomponent Na+:H+ antiporter subunit G